MLNQGAQHANSSPPDRHGVGAPEEDFRRNIQAEGAECIDGIHAKPSLNSATFYNGPRLLQGSEGLQALPVEVICQQDGTPSPEFGMDNFACLDPGIRVGAAVMAVDSRTDVR
jgi:hypothetical protein